MTSMQDCIADCLDCHSVCLATIAHCLKKGGDHAAPEHIRLLQDCAQICIVSADFMLRGSPMHRNDVSHVRRNLHRVCGRLLETCRRRDDGALRRDLPPLCAKLRQDGGRRPQGGLATAILRAPSAIEAAPSISSFERTWLPLRLPYVRAVLRSALPSWPPSGRDRHPSPER